MTTPNNQQRALERVRPIVAAYAETAGMKLPNDLDTALQDLVCDLLHYANSDELGEEFEGFDSVTLIDWALWHFNEELAEDSDPRVAS